jgi:hypothetical protein
LRFWVSEILKRALMIDYGLAADLSADRVEA